MANFLHIDPGMIDANLAYLTLLLGLWAVVTAFYIPGTGIAEVIAFVVLVVAMIILAIVPTSWIAVLVMVLGVVGFLTLPFIKPDWAGLAELGLILQAIGGFFLINGQSVSVIVIAITVAMAWAYNRYLLIPMLKSQESIGYEDAELVGSTGRVVAPITTGTGTVHVNGELWTARSDDPIESGTLILVIEKQGLELKVEKSKR